MGRDRLFAELGKVGCWWREKPRNGQDQLVLRPNLPVFKNLIRRCQVTGPNQVWVADITYIRTQQGFLYCPAHRQVVGARIVGFHLGETLETSDSLKA